MEEREELIRKYFRLGLSNLEIRSMLAIYYRLLISERHLKRLMSHMNLFRRNNRTPLISVLNFIEEEIQGPGQLHGYRWTHHRCRRNGLSVSKKTVRLILSAIDPDGAEHRKRRRLVRRRYITRGPNIVWHIDGYDKLKPYGVAMHGCVDGFSRTVIWLNAFYTNNNPRVIAGYYFEAISMLEGCPRVVRGDRGTENAFICQMQRFLRRNGADAQDNCVFIYGTSASNQRNESFWSMLRKHFGQFWIDLFGSLQDEGCYSGDELDKHL
ncbi:hypothetical protein HOLleu_36508 [Holothuria leucospilota]|uniref:Integrase core domain-containing protein n=1 Tax=Holothuria leucospilota TaxID=206669 RepID=A0A9Q1BG31_HOLLE|nr:hypothetical protein HOLleu_36508 [Holothuria leucospilota]